MNQETFENILNFIVTFIILFVIGTLVYLSFKLLFVGFEYSWGSYLTFNSIFSIIGTLYVFINIEN